MRTISFLEMQGSYYPHAQRSHPKRKKSSATPFRKKTQIRIYATPLPFQPIVSLVALCYHPSPLLAATHIMHS